VEKLILITGGSSGIGKQLAMDLLKSGEKVIIVGEKAARLDRAVKELSAISPKIFGQCCDIGNDDDVFRLKEQVFKTHGCPDILINNAGFAVYRTFEETDPKEIDRLVQVNLLGAMRCTHAFLSEMISRKHGTIVNMASIAGRIIITPNATYGAAKHALVAWSEALRYELARFHIQVNVICPGRVETPFFDHETFQNRAKRPETRFTISLEDISRATWRAIAKDQFITYVPWTLGMLVWLTSAFPFLVKPIYGRLIRARIESIYKQSNR